MNKQEIAALFEEIADLLELQDENPFRIRAYRNAARSLVATDKDLKKMVRDGTLTDLEGVGDDLADKIETLATEGRLPFYEKLKKSVPPVFFELRQVQGLGPKKIQILYQKLKIRSIEDLKKAAEAGKLAKLKGFGGKTEKNILNALENRESYGKRYLWWAAMPVAGPLLEELKKLKEVKKAELAGSLRRKLETIGDLDFLVASSNPKKVMDWFTSHKDVESVISRGETKSSVRMKGGMQADLRIVPEKQFGFALTYFIGSKEHNIKIRQRSLKRGWSLSEYGLESLEKKTKSPFDQAKRAVTEEEIYKALGLSFIPPELREDRGEIEAAEKGKLPKLIEESDLKGAFHAHTVASDGKSSLKEMAEAADKLGWEYLGISDHSKSSFQANGLSEERLKEQIEEVKKLNASKKFRTHIFIGSECDILPNGTLDFPDKILKQLDFVIASVHSSLTQDEKTMTKRIIRALENPYVTILGHLTGRLLLKREGYKVNVAKVIDACIANKKVMELNANPMRLDMDWRYWHNAAEKGLLCAIDPDAHSASHLVFVLAGINAARKGWLEKRHVINTRSLKEMQDFLRKSRS